MVKSWSVLSILVALAAVLFTFFPSLRSALPFLGPQEISEEQRRIEALASAQNYTYTTVLDDPPLIYIDDFLSAAEIDEILNVRYGCLPPRLLLLTDFCSARPCSILHRCTAQIIRLRSTGPPLPAFFLPRILWHPWSLPEPCNFWPT